MKTTRPAAARVFACLSVVALVVAAAGMAAGQGSGTVQGTVYDASTGEPLAGAGVTLLETEQRTESDRDGRFQLDVEPGAYTVRVAAPAYGSATVAVRVTAGGLADASTSLSPTGAVIDILEIVAEAHQAAEATQLLERKTASYVSDNIGAQLIRQSTDSDAAEVVRRLPAITVRDNKFVFIRGLGERYSGALLNGSRLPSTDPDKRVVSLDLFPASFIESMSIKKSFSPEFPGDSAALVDIRLRKHPEELTYGLSVSTSFNTASTFRDFATYDRGGLDYLGFGERRRRLPSLIPRDRLAADATSSTSRQRALHGSFRNVWDSENMDGLPAWGATAHLGNRFGPLGIMGAATYGTNHKVRRNRLVRSYRNVDGQLDDFAYDESVFETTLGAILNTSYEIDDRHQIGLQSFINRGSQDEVRDGIGRTDEDPDDDTRNLRLRYREDQLAYGRLGGTHEFDAVEFGWRSAISTTSRLEPDQRFVKSKRLTGSGLPFGVFPKRPSLVRTYNDLDEWMSDSAADVTVPLRPRWERLPAWQGEEVKLRFGGAYTYRDRSFRMRRFGVSGPSGAFDAIRTLPTQQILRVENFGPDGLQFGETTTPADRFDANQEIVGGYGMAELPLLPRSLRVVGGARFEQSLLRTIAVAPTGRPANARLEDTDVMPSVNFIYSPRDDMNIRYGFSRTVSRPEFRELTPTLFPAVDAERVVLGNQFLVSTLIRAHDVRWEWFPSDNEVLSVSLFEKEIPNAIEAVSKSTTTASVTGFRNADAYIWGFEVEARANVATLPNQWSLLQRQTGLMAQLERWSIITNLSLIESKASIRKPGEGICSTGNAQDAPDECFEDQTNESRRLQGQAPFVVNIGLQFDDEWFGTLRLLYNTTGPVVAAAGINGLADIIEQRRDQLDLVWLGKIEPFSVPLQLKAGVENILNDSYREKQGQILVDRYRTGTTFGFSLAYSF